jgi:osmoprotectant transport system permease protein
MEQLIAGVRFLIDNPGMVGRLFGEHLQLAGISLAISLVIAIPLGWLISRVHWLRGPVLGVLGVIYTIPSLSLFVLLIPVLGLGARTAIVALVAYAQLVLVRNVLIGLTGIDPAIVEAAKGMGMNGWQRFSRVEFPLALPLILAGTRVATLSIIGIGTVAAFIGAGGLGQLLFQGVSTGSRPRIVAGSISIILLAFGANLILRFLEQRASRVVHGEDQPAPSS